MANFLVRVVLHGANNDNYESLHAKMEQLGFLRTIKGSDGIIYDLPHAEYSIVSAHSAGQVRDYVRGAADATGKTNAVLAIEYTAASWIGLAKKTN